MPSSRRIVEALVSRLGISRHGRFARELDQATDDIEKILGERASDVEHTREEVLPAMSIHPRGPVAEATSNVFRALGELTRSIGELIFAFTGQPPSHPHLKGGRFMIIVKDDNPDVRYAVGGFTVTDAEGSPVPGAQVTVKVESDNPSAVAVTEDASPAPGSGSGSVAFGSPNPDGSPSQATVTAKVMFGDKVVGLFTETFGVTAGDPAAIVGGAMTFEGLTPADASPAPSEPTPVPAPEPPADQPPA